MDEETQARLHAIELLLAEMIAAQFRATPDPAEIAADALKSLQPVIWDMPLRAENLDAEGRMRQLIEDAVADVLKEALHRAV